MTFSCRGMVLGVAWIHLVGVGFGIRITRGVIGSWNYAFLLTI